MLHTGEDELRRTMDRIIHAAKAAVTGPHAAGDPTAAPAPAAAASPAPAKPTASSNPSAPTVSGTAAAAAATSTISGTAAGAATGTSSSGLAPAAAAAAANAGAAAGGLSVRLMSTEKFMKQMGKKQGFRKEAQGFFDRWVHGTGEGCMGSTCSVAAHADLNCTAGQQPVLAVHICLETAALAAAACLFRIGLFMDHERNKLLFPARAGVRGKEVLARIGSLPWTVTRCVVRVKPHLETAVVPVRLTP